MSDLIPMPDLEIRNEYELAAQAISRVSGGLDATIIKSWQKTLVELLAIAEAGGLPSPLCSELTNANPSSPHTVLLEAKAWLLAQIAFRLNQVPKQNQIEFARLFGITLKDAIAATTTLRFTVLAPDGFSVVIPQGSQVATTDGSYVFLTNTQLVIPSTGVETTGEVLAHRSVKGHTLLTPNLLTNLLDPIAYVTAVTNLNAIDSGSEDETIDSALERARQYQQRGERIVTIKDLEEAILNDALDGNGIVRAFPFIEEGDFSTQKLGRTTVVVMTRTGDPIGTAERNKITALLAQIIGNQFVYLFDPFYVDFNVDATVKLTSRAVQDATIKAIRKNIQNFYAPTNANFGRTISRSEIIALIEGTEGVDMIVGTFNGNVISQPLTDRRLQTWELPRPVSISIQVQN